MSPVRRIPLLGTLLIASAAGLATPALAQDTGTPSAEALAQVHAGHPEDVLGPPKIYSPYVGRTAVDSNCAEGVLGDTHRG